MVGSVWESDNPGQKPHSGWERGGVAGGVSLWCRRRGCLGRGVTRLFGAQGSSGVGQAVSAAERVVSRPFLGGYRGGRRELSVG